MPGVSLVSSPAVNPGEFDGRLDEVLYFDDYSKEILYSAEDVVLGWTGYDAYPVRTFDTGSHVVVLEGHLYATSDVESTVATVLDFIERGDHGAIERWLGNRDGEFVLLFVDKATHEITVLNDALGRLPVYQYQTSDGVVFSRELGFILESSDVTLDSMSVAQMLLFGYPLGQRTPYRDVTQISPGSIVRVEGNEVSTEQLYRVRIDETAYDDRSVETNAEQVATRFSTACRRRAAVGGENIISLSGGLDSRAIAACFRGNDLPFVAATFERRDGSDASEVAIAEEVMQSLGGEWQSFDVSETTRTQLSDLLDLKRGMNGISMGFILEFFDRLVESYGRDAVYFAGDGGDKLLPPLAPKSFDDERDVVDFLLRNESRFNIDTVAEITGVSQSALRTAVRTRIDSYPGSDATATYAQFLFWERGGNWLLHGEDRNRYFLWNAAPFYSLPVVEYAMRIPDEQKAQSTLFKALFREYAPELVDIEYANVGTSINTYEYKLKQMGYDRLCRHPQLRDLVVSLMKGDLGSKYPESLAALLREQARHGALETTFSTDALQDIASNRRKYSETAVYILLTLTTAMEQLAEGETVLDRAEEVPFA